MTEQRPTLVCAHGLGLSSRLFDRTSELLAAEADTLAIDLPGFGDAAPADGPLLEASILAVEDAVRAHELEHWVAVGHSMGGKVMTLVTARALEGRNGLPAPAAVALLAASPPSPEPMDEDRRKSMLAWAEAPTIAAVHAREFVDGNTAGPLPTWADELAMTDVERSAPEAWRSWLTEGSLQNAAIGLPPLRVPAVIAAGSADGDLGIVAQREHNLPHYPLGRVHEIEGAAHFLPLERPDAVAELVSGLLRALRS